MKTIWGDHLKKDNVLPEYPRPQLVRESYLNLNGVWSYGITEDDKLPDSFDGEIVVPFSPESELSGVMRSLLPTQTLWYRRTLQLPPDFNVGRVLLHFGAVDQLATVYVNGAEVCEHVGGYTPFYADITEHLQQDITILVKVRDLSDTSHHSRGKQRTKRGGIWYTAQSGIWQTVWMESVPKEYISALRITPIFDEGALELTVISEGSALCFVSIGDRSGNAVAVSSGSVNVNESSSGSRSGQAIGEAATSESATASPSPDTAFETITALMPNQPTKLYFDSFHPWTPEQPYLYDLTLTMGQDTVKSYFGMRKFSVEPDQYGVQRLFLNNKPYFHNGLLDQGYYSDGIYTAPSEEAMIFDIQTAKDMGFNMLRKHIKIEPLRWYYHCDRLGMLVWQDMVNGGGEYRFITIATPIVTGIHCKDHRYRWFAREDAEGRRQYYRELAETISHLYNTVSIAMWVPFNEGWGQFDAGEAVRRIMELDATRTIDHASGWHDQRIGAFKSLHVYFKKYRFKPDKLGRAVILSEFGGYNYRVEGHSFNNSNFGYKRVQTAEDLLAAYERLYENEILPALGKGLSAAVYTQLTDVEDELNGLITYDRKVIKLPVLKVRRINERVRIQYNRS